MTKLFHVFTLALLIAAHSATAQSGYSKENPPPAPKKSPAAAKSAACAPSVARRELAWNNIRALIETGGSMWYDRSVSRAAYEAPIGGGVSCIYAGALWMGGLSPDLQLKLAAIQYRWEGNDYWPGPLSTDGAAEVDADVCAEWDRFYVSLRTDAIRHRQYSECLKDPDCDSEELLGGTYATPSYFYDWPAHGSAAEQQDYYLAPFFDFDADGAYDPSAGDYPWFDFLQDIDCANRKRTDPVPLYGDYNMFWIFNDKGNVHSESNGQPIGMEVRAQAFAFATSDEINNMTFYNYTLINQGSQTLTQTYFGTFIESDIGGHVDDFVGCDVQRGLGYAYNGPAFDPPSSISAGYGENPPAIGVDFFEGPFQDEDGIDNPLTTDFAVAIAQKGIPYPGIGIGYGDDIVDNERFGMRKFVYGNYSNAINGIPNTAAEYYNYLRGYWRNGQRMTYGGDGLNPLTGTDPAIPADYMFPDDTDPYNWGTVGITVDPWTEETAGNPPGDRRFSQSAGPFTLEPGDYNNITFGVVFARALNGDPFQSVELVRRADDKAQALFDNCFELVSGPDAPEVALVEMEKEIVVYWTNNNPLSNNYLEQYQALDPSIPKETEAGELTELERSYVFEGYMVYQVRDAEVSVSDLGDVELARLIFQCDVENYDEAENPIDMLVNYDFDPELNLTVPKLMVDGANAGLKHAISVKEDQFATGNKSLVNYKTYYFMVLAYGYNNFAPYDPTFGSGQTAQFKLSRKSAIGSIKTIAGIPHPTASQSGGLIQNAGYGDGVVITKHEGYGNADNLLDISTAMREKIFSDNISTEITYEAGRGPVSISVVDPLRVPAADFELRLNPDDLNYSDDSLGWVLTNLTWLNDADASNDQDAVFESRTAFQLPSEELLVDLGLSIDFSQYFYTNNNRYTRPIENGSTMTFTNPDRPWLQGIPDEEGFTPLNWIRSGTLDSEDAPDDLFNDNGATFDADERYEGILGGTWAPFICVSQSAIDEENDVIINVAPSGAAVASLPSYISDSPNVDIVITSDKSKWSRVPVLEMQLQEDLAQNELGGAAPDKMRFRKHKSVDKNGRTEDDPGVNTAEANLVSATGMGWFPGYAVDLGTGERLNMAFGEDSWFGSQNGRDMIWNPGSEVEGSTGEFLAGGQHWIYVFSNNRHQSGNDGRMPAYDGGAYMYSKVEVANSPNNMRDVFRACGWVGSALTNPDYPMLSPEQGLVPNDVLIRLRLAKTYDKWSPTQIDTDELAGSQNNWNPLYTFSTKDIAPLSNDGATLESSLDRINVVPNPYYAFSTYETGKLDNRIKIINLPEQCTISIFGLNGTLIRQFKKAGPETFQDWDLKNARNIPISSGVYLIYVDVPGTGQKVLKWFGVMRPTDLDNF